MEAVNINVRTDATLKAQAQQIFESIGLDLSSAVNLFLVQTVKANNLPFAVGVSNVYSQNNTTGNRVSRYGVWKGKYTLPEGFDEPLNDFQEYM